MSDTPNVDESFESTVKRYAVALLSEVQEGEGRQRRSVGFREEGDSLVVEVKASERGSEDVIVLNRGMVRLLIGGLIDWLAKGVPSVPEEGEARRLATDVLDAQRVFDAHVRRRAMDSER